jgi:hypothetical protein
MAWKNAALSAKTYGKAERMLRKRYKAEFKAMELQEGMNEARAQAKLNRTYHKEFRELVNQVAQQTGLGTTEMRRARMIERLEKQIEQLRGTINDLNTRT